MSRFTSHAEWPSGTIPGTDKQFSEDSHASLGQALGVCRLLERNGFGGDGKIFPLRTWVIDQARGVIVAGAPECGPIYGVELLRRLPMNDGGDMFQAMPSRSDLKHVERINARVVAGYEVLLQHFRTAVSLLERVEDRPVSPEKGAALRAELVSYLTKIRPTVQVSDGQEGGAS